MGGGATRHRQEEQAGGPTPPWNDEDQTLLAGRRGDSGNKNGKLPQLYTQRESAVCAVTAKYYVFKMVKGFSYT